MSILKIANEERIKRLENGAIRGAGIGATTGAASGYLAHRSIENVYKKVGKNFSEMHPLKKKIMEKVFFKFPSFSKMKIKKAPLMALGALTGLSLGTGSGVLAASLGNKANDRLSKRNMENA